VQDLLIRLADCVTANVLRDVGGDFDFRIFGSPEGFPVSDVLMLSL
jgi:hypothetical protein